MAIVKVIEVLAESPKSWEDAVQIGIKEVSMTVKNIKSVYIKEFQALVENNKIVKYRVNGKISFIIDDDIRHTK